jgi:hypothetical protein
MGGSRAVEQQRGNIAPPLEMRVRMWPSSTSNSFHTSLAFHPSSLIARSSMNSGTRGVGSQWYCTTGSRSRSRGMEASSWVVVSPALRWILYGADA